MSAHNAVMESALELGEIWNWDWEQIDAHLESEFGPYDDMAVLLELQDRGRCQDVLAGRFELQTLVPA